MLEYAESKAKNCLGGVLNFYSTLLWVYAALVATWSIVALLNSGNALLRVSAAIAFNELRLGLSNHMILHVKSAGFDAQTSA